MYGFIINISLVYARAHVYFHVKPINFVHRFLNDFILFQRSDCINQLREGADHIFEHKHIGASKKLFGFKKNYGNLGDLTRLLTS